MIAAQVARIVARVVVFTESLEEEDLNPDAAVELQEQLAGDVQALEPAFLRQVVDAFPVIAAEYPEEETQDLIRAIPEDFGLEEALAGDDAD